MFRVVLAGLLFVLSSGVYAFQFPIEMIERVDGATVVVNINEEDIDAAASWKPFGAAPPLTVAEAIAAVKAEIAQDPGMRDATLKEIQLRPIPHHENSWHYMVVLKSPGDGRRVLHYYAVLMTGKVISAIREPESYK